MNYLALYTITVFLLCISIAALFMYSGNLTTTVFISINGLVYHQSVLPDPMELGAPVDVVLTVLDSTTLAIMSLGRVTLGVMLDFTDIHVLLNAIVAVLDRVIVSLDSVTGVVILDITETGVAMNAALVVAGLPKPVTVSVEPVISVIQGFMEGCAQLSVTSTVLGQTTHVESMESVILAVILGIGEKRVPIAATPTVVA